ncbi:MAG: hypothetical protein KDA31_08225 [Phycisphaerales bacterium]|nr:hypothetical protein [Phycisphaerales bacterium]MCB9835896.1 hypothetical protein [Phycisphaera sp.]
MTEPLNRSKPLLSMTAPVAGLSTAGVLTAAAHLKLATFALGAWTFPLAIVIPGVIGGRQLMASRPLVRTCLLTGAAIGLNLGIEALGTATQLRFLG